jgi:hypothetical protein
VSREEAKSCLLPSKHGVIKQVTTKEAISSDCAASFSLPQQALPFAPCESKLYSNFQKQSFI